MASKTGFKLKITSANGFSSQRVTSEDNPRGLAELVTTSIKEEVCKVICGTVKEEVFQHNLRVIFQTAMFFQRVVNRTPKDEEYRDAHNRLHKPDDDYVWKSWSVEYDKKKVTAEEMGEYLFSDWLEGTSFNDLNSINIVSNEIMDRLFGGFTGLRERTKFIRSIRIVNTHPRFAMLEYGGYEISDTPTPVKYDYWHGVKNGYSVQAPYGMLRITQAEIESMTMKDYLSYIKRFKTYNSSVRKVPSQSKMKTLMKLITDKTHLSSKDIEFIAEQYRV